MTPAKTARRVCKQDVINTGKWPGLTMTFVSFGVCVYVHVRACVRAQECVCVCVEGVRVEARETKRVWRGGERSDKNFK